MKLTPEQKQELGTLLKAKPETNEEHGKNKKRIKQLQALEFVVEGYKFNPFPNRRERRAAARRAGYMPHGWSIYRAGSGPQTVIKNKTEV